jgi:hypothetical protein
MSRLEETFFNHLKSVSYDLNNELLNSIEFSMIELFEKEEENAQQLVHKTHSYLIDLHHRMKNYVSNEKKILDLMTKVYIIFSKKQEFNQFLVNV